MSLGPLRNFSYAPACGLDPASEECIATIQNWLNQCVSAHPRCSVNADPKLPHRIIDICPRENCNSLKLVETHSHYAKYITLSHCWGNIQPYKTCKANLQNHLREIKLSEMPQTFKDAVFLTAKLGVQYLWIDSICIIQDDSNDWAIESANIATIFENSYLTIAASISPNCHHGFLNPRPDPGNYASLQPSYQGKPLPPPFNEVRIRRCLHERPHCYYLAKQGEDPLDSRLWAVQEHLLPTRVLSYRRNELTWQCKTRQGCECRGLGEKYSILDTASWGRQEYHTFMDLSTTGPLSETSRKAFFRWWSNGLVLASQKKLSYESDKLSAISGIASSMQNALEDTYLAGMWKSDLSNSLGWRSSRRNTIPDCYRAPSWCWSSLIGETTMRDASNEFVVLDVSSPKITIVDFQCIPATANPFGWVKKGAYLEISGYLLSAVLTGTRYDHLRVRFRDLPAAFEAIKDYHVRFVADSSLAPAFVRHENGQDEVTPTRSNLRSETFTLDDCPVFSLWLNISTFSKNADRLEFLILGKSLCVPGAYTRVGLGIAYVPRFVLETFPKIEKQKAARWKAPTTFQKMGSKIKRPKPTMLKIA